MTQRILLIENPVSGLRFKHKSERQIEKILSKKFDVDTYRTKAKADALRKAAERGEFYDIVAVSGGDGTVNEVIAGLMRIPKEKRPSLACIPAGTSNLLCDVLGVPPNLAEAAEVAINCSAHSLDIGKIDDVYFATAISFGYFTDTTYKTPQPLKNIFGYGAYLMGAVKSLAELEPYKMRITHDGEVIEDEFILGAVSNVYSVGGIIKLDSSVVSTDDGLFEVLFIKKPSNAAEFGALVSSLTYKEYNSDIVRFFQTNELKLEIEKPIPWTVDGEYVKDFASVDIKLHADAIKVFRPLIASDLVSEKK